MERRHGDSDVLDEILQFLRDRDERLRELLAEEIEKANKPIVEKLSEHHRTLFGDGSEGNQGLRVDVDRVKQRGILINWGMGILGGGFLLDIGRRAWDHIFK